MAGDDCNHRDHGDVFRGCCLGNVNWMWSCSCTCWAIRENNNTASQYLKSIWPYNTIAGFDFPPLAFIVYLHACVWITFSHFLRFAGILVQAISMDHAMTRQPTPTASCWRAHHYELARSWWWFSDRRGRHHQCRLRAYCALTSHVESDEDALNLKLIYVVYFHI